MTRRGFTTFQLTVVNSPVTPRMKQYAVADTIASTVDSPDNLMASASGRPRDLVAAFSAPGYVLHY